MIELGGQSPATDLIKDVSEADFMTEVVEMSRTVPVIVDFWAPWCGPCKTLGPALETAVNKAKGAVRMAKVNVDENQAIAGQLQIQSLPTVYAFWQGQPIDGFQGNVPASELDAFIGRVVEASGGAAGGAEADGLAEAITAADEMLEAGDAAGALQVFAAIAAEDPANAASFGGMARAHIAAGDLEQAEAVLNGAPADLHDKPEIEAAHAQLALARQAADAGPVADLEAAVEADPGNHQARYDLALALAAAGRSEEAVDHLLELFRRDADWNDGAAKTQLFTVFDALKPNDPVVLNGRRKLSSLIFA
ncbi:thioredoxin family protein [Roseovarius nanhaiticus]|uniref:thioredoxin family protein n=1 Tax=Roseovarius nanhaiticus TaxID=573024 RepID=UPI0024909F2A|nr:co-chaperone YbbN [Roseovarius nanhaiticus]